MGQGCAGGEGGAGAGGLVLEGASSRALISSVRALVVAWVLVSALTGDRDLALLLLLLLLLLLRPRTD